MRNTYKNLSSGVRLSLPLRFTQGKLLSGAKGRMPLMVFLVCLVGSLPVCPLTRSMDSMTALAESIRLGAIKAEVNGAIITDDDVKRQAAVPLREAIEKYKGRELNERATQILSDILDELIDRQLLVQEAGKIIKDNPIIKEALEREAESFLKDAMDKVGGPARFYELATKEGINPAEKKKELKEDLMAEALLKEFGGVLLRDLRSSDLLARMGKERFAMLLPHTSVNQALLAWDLIVRQLLQFSAHQPYLQEAIRLCLSRSQCLFVILIVRIHSLSVN